ncbi:hypothetical protein ACVW1A_000126 [Bradyrhizobium sp. LB1.3]
MPFDPEKKQFSMAMPENMQESSLLITAMGQSIMTLLDKLAETHGDRPGPWLDEIEKTLIRDAKGTVTEDIHVVTEARGMGLGVEAITALIQRLRRKLNTE